METQAPFYVRSEVIPLPAPLESAVREDLLSRINRRLGYEMSWIRNTSPSVDWRVAALQAQAQVYALRFGNPLPRFRPA